MQARELEQGHVEDGIEAPDLVPTAFLKELVAVGQTLGPAVKGGLDTARKGLESEHHVRIATMQRGDRVELPIVMGGAVVDLAEKDDRTPRHGCHQVVDRDHFAVPGLPPLTRIDAGIRGHARRRGGDGDSQDDGRNSQALHGDIAVAEGVGEQHARDHPSVKAAMGNDYGSLTESGQAATPRRHV